MASFIKGRYPVQAGEEEEPARSWPRWVFADVEVDCADQETFLFCYLCDHDDTGIFVHTVSPEAPGTAVSLRLQHGEAEPLALDGEVIWVNPYRPANATSLNPGMGIRLQGLSGEQRARLLGLVKRLAYLVPDEPDAGHAGR